MEPTVLDPYSQRTLELFRVAFAYRLEAPHTEGRLAVLEVVIPPKTLVKPHQHSREEEFSLVHDGRVGARIGDTTHEEILAGSWIAKPRDVPHAMWNIAEEPAASSSSSCPGASSGTSTGCLRFSPRKGRSGPSATTRPRLSPG